MSHDKHVVMNTNNVTQTMSHNFIILNSLYMVNNDACINNLFKFLKKACKNGEIGVIKSLIMLTFKIEPKLHMVIIVFLLIFCIITSFYPNELKFNGSF